MKNIVCILLVFIAANQSLQAQSGKEVSVEDIWKKYLFYAKSFPGFRSMNDGEHFTRINRNGNHFSITKHAFKSNQDDAGETLVGASDLQYKSTRIEVDEYSFNKDESKMLIQTNTKSIYRHSYSADYFVLDLKSKKLSELDAKNQLKTLAEFSPDGSKVAYVSGNNLFIKDLEANKIMQVTTDGKRNEIINGTTDWVYEEEFAIIKGFCWSPDSRYLAYLRFDESKVKEFQMAIYGSLYPDQYTFKYPKAGEANSKVSCHLFLLEKNEHRDVQLGKYEYIPRLNWASEKNHLIVQTLNRHQNQIRYHQVDVTKNDQMAVKMFFEEESETYVEIDDNLIILEKEDALLRVSESSGYRHIHQVGFDGTNKQITTGSWDVIEFYGVDESKGYIYYSAAEKAPIHKGIYRINTNGKKKEAISDESGYNNAEFSTGMKYFMKSHSSANTPPVYTLCQADGKELMTLEDNAKLKKRLSEYQLSEKEFTTFQGATEQLNAWMIKPPNFDPNKKYPVYMMIYCGPGSNTVQDQFGGSNYMYHQLLAQKGYIVVSVDPRGTMYRGTKFKNSTYQQLGKLETEDLIASAKYLAKLPYVDAKRIGIQGWSYGGYMTSLAMTKGAEYFKMGIAVAPVTNWRYYDNIYTERFMRTPQENAAGYDDNSPINHVKKMKGKYLLIHGSADDNVHFQNTMEMVRALTEANVQFDLFIYPNKNHGIYGGNTRNHLFNMMLNYTLQNL
ncbi:MAG: S9 family peptidase [Bacteroidetes bacterium]|nr:MAG: S9 family peptidase [Bacteroidota bacterium]